MLWDCVLEAERLQLRMDVLLVGLVVERQRTSLTKVLST